MNVKRFLSVFLVLVMLAGMIPLGSFAATDLNWNGGTITLESGTKIGSYTLTTLSIYKQGATSNYPTITEATQDGTTINITLAEGTDLSYPLQMGFAGNGGSVQNSGNTCTLKGGKGTATVTVIAKPAPQPNAPVLGQGTFTVNFTVETGEVFAVTMPEGEGFSFIGDEIAGKNQDYVFTIEINEGYDGENMVVYVNDEEVSGVDGTYTVENVEEDLYITVDGIAKKEICTITPPTGEGFIFAGAEKIYKGDDYTFTIAIDDAYDGTDMLVKANGEAVEGIDGRYTITSVSEDVEICVEGIVKKTVYSVTLTNGEGYTISGRDTCYAGMPYTFSVTVDDRYLSDDMVVKVNDEEVGLTNGSYTIASVDENIEISVEGIRAKEVYNISKNAEEGVTIEGEDTALENDDYTFTVIVDGKYDTSNMLVKVDGAKVDLSDGSYTIKSVSGNVVIEVSGVTLKPICKVTKPVGERFTFTGDEYAVKGHDYIFTVTPQIGYILTVSVNDEVVSGSNDTYTVNTDVDELVITVTAEREALPDKEIGISSENDTYKIDVSDKKLTTFISYHATVTGINITGAKVTEAYENGNKIYFILHSDTPDDAALGVEFIYTNNGCTLKNNKTDITLQSGDAGVKHKVTADYSNGFKTNTAEYMLIFFRETPAENPPVCIKTTDTKEVWKDRSLEFDLGEYFTDADAYYLVDGEEKKLLDNKIYTFTSSVAGNHTLLFAASNEAGEAAELLTVTINVKDVESGVYVGHETGSGAWNYVQFLDAEDALIEGVDVSYDMANRLISVLLPKDYSVSGTVKAKFNLTQNESGYPILSTTSETTANRPYGARFTEKSIGLTAGTANLTFYYYNSSTGATNNGGQTKFTISVKIKNDRPVLAEGVASTANATITAGENYTLDLSPLFTDIDEDALNYKVSINGETATEADANYTFTTEVAGTYTLVFTANDSKDDSSDTYTVTLTVENSDKTDSMTVNIPDGLTPTFYVSPGFEDGTDKTGDVIDAVKGISIDGMTAYTLNYPINAKLISIRTPDFGGMAFGAEKDSTVSFRRVQLKVVDYDDNEALSTNTAAYGENTAVGGESGWLLATGREYVFTAIPENTDLAKASKNVTIEDGTEIQEEKLVLGISNPMSITVPTGAKAQLYKYKQYYSNTEFDAKIIADNGDGTTTYQFVADTKDGSYIYLVSMEGKITKAGWVKWGAQNLNITYTEDDKSPSYRLDDYSATGETNGPIAEDSVLLNINSRNHLHLAVGESKTLKAYRAWEIIPLSYSNYIISPDFTYKVLLGSDVVSLEEKASPSAGNGDWMTLTAQKDGIAVIEVTYDAIDTKGGDHFEGIYGASDPARSGLVIVQVGENDDASVKFGIKSFASIGKLGKQNISYNPEKQKEWDSEFDTLYFLGENGEIELQPTASSAIEEVAISSDKGASWTKISDANGIYTAKIVSGNNILRVKTECGTAYQVVRGDKVTVKFSEITEKSNNDGIVDAGETIRVRLVGLHSPIPKMAGNYNPGYGGNTDGYSKQHINYTCNGEAVYGPGAQYDFITSANYIDIVMPEDGSDVTLKDGYIGVGVVGLMAFTDGGDSHRNIPDNGCSTRGSQSTFHTRSILPEITLSVGDSSAPNSAPVVRADAVTEAKIYSDQNFAINPDTLFTDPDDDTMTFTVSVNDAEATDAPLDYKFSPNKTGTYSLLFTATDGKETAKHTITLTVTNRPSEGGGGNNESEDDFGLDASEIAGYVTISFTDKGERVKGESGLKYPKPLGTIISATKVPYKKGEKITHVTKRLLDHLGIRMEYTGTLESGFYLGAICNFEVKGTPYDSMGEFDAGVGSGWMITFNKNFIKYGASEFEVKNGDIIKWQYTCQLGKDIGDPFYSGSSSSSSSNKNNKTEEEKKEDKEEIKEEQKEESPKNTFTETTFADVKKDHWHYESVRYAYENNLMQGTDNGFEPDSKMSRAMLVTVLFRMAKPENIKTTHSFEDVPEGQWYSDAIAWAASNGIVNGITSTEFAPNSDISREQMALIIYRFAKFCGYDVSDAADLSNFTDTGDVSDWALDALCWANKTGLINGMSETSLLPKATATRAQVAAILMRFCENVAK